MITYDLSNGKRSKCLDKAITPNSFSHLLVPVCHPRLVQVVFCHLGQIPGSAFSRFPGFSTQPALHNVQTSQMPLLLPPIETSMG